MYPSAVFTHLTFLERSALAPPPGRVSLCPVQCPPPSRRNWPAVLLSTGPWSLR